MLIVDPKNRISAKEALKDPWVTKNASSANLNTKVLSNLSGFTVKNYHMSYFNYYLNREKIS